MAYSQETQALLDDLNAAFEPFAWVNTWIDNAIYNKYTNDHIFTLACLNNSLFPRCRVCAHTEDNPHASLDSAPLKRL